MTEVAVIGEDKEMTKHVARPAEIVLPAVKPDDAIKAFKSYQELSSAVLDDSDFQSFWSGGSEKKFKKKTAWRKYAMFFNLTVECIEEKEVELAQGFAFDVRYRAVAPNGRSAEGDGCCESHESLDKEGNPLIKTRHDTRSTAHTRAFNRAVSNLIGFGEVSADEINPHTGEVTRAQDTSEVTLDTKFSFGKFKGKTIQEVGFVEAKSYCEFLKKKNEEEGKQFRGQGKKIYDFLIQAQEEMRAKKQQASASYQGEQAAEAEDMPSPFDEPQPREFLGEDYDR